MTANPSRKHLVLIGAGRAHIQVLKGLARHGAANLSVTLVAPHPFYIEPGMLPGYVAGDYGLEDVRIPLEAIIEASGAVFLPASVLTLDAAARRVQLSSGDALSYDVLSVDQEPTPERDLVEDIIPGARRNALFIHPYMAFLQLWPQLQALARERALHVAVAGDDLAGAELAMALSQALAAPHGSRVSLIAGEDPFLRDQPPALQRRVLARLKAMNITVLQDRCTGMDGRAVQLASGASLQCDAPLLALSAATAPWLAGGGLQTDDMGMPLVNERLQSDSHRQVFIVPADAPAEVGPVLEANLRTALDGGSFKQAPLHARRLRVVSCGSGHAIAVWGPLGLEGREVWHFKVRSDRRQLAALMAL